MQSEGQSIHDARRAAPAAVPVSGLFAGRRREMRELVQALEAARAGQGRLTMLVGEPGIGKTRTAQELAAHAAEAGVGVHWGRSQESSGAPPYWPWVQVIRSYIRDQDPGTLRADLGAGADDVAEIVPELAALMPDVASQSLQDPEQARFRLFDAVTTFFVRAAERRPLMLVLDNLHWADTPSLLLLQFLAAEIPRSGLLLVGTYRDVELSRQHPLTDTLAELTRENLMSRVVLRGLSEEEAGDLVSAAAEGPLPAGLVQAVHRQTEGNPLFLTETVRLLAQEGWLRGGRLPAAGSLSLRIPEGIRAVIGKRLNRLSDTANRALSIASVIGREFGFGELEPLVEELDREKVIEVLEEARANWIVEELPAQPGRFQFTHALIRETLYDELSTLRRVQLHRKFGEALARLHSGNVGPYLNQLAYHFFEAASSGAAAQAAGYAVQAAERALAMLAYEEAARHYEMAVQTIDWVEPADERKRCELLLGMADAQAKSGKYPDAMRSYQRAFELAWSLGWAEGQAAAAVGFEDASWRPGLPGKPAALLLERALDALGPGDSVVRSRALASFARALHFVGETERAQDVGREAISMARRIGDRPTLAYVLRANIKDQFRPDRESLGDRLAAEDEIEELARQTGDVALEMDTRTWRCLDLLASGDIPVAKRSLDEMQGLARRLRSPFSGYVAASCWAVLAVSEGRLGEAERLIEEAQAVGQRVRGEDLLGVHGLQMFTLRREQGRLDEVAPLVRTVVERGIDASVWRPGLAAVYAELGMLGEARAEFERFASNDFDDLPRDGVWVVCMVFFAEVCARLGDARRAAVLYDKLRPWGPYNVVVSGAVTCYGAGSRYLGMLAATMGRFDDAERHFRHAVDLNTRMGARTWLAHTQHGYAGMLVARNGPTDREQAAELAAEALSTARKLGMRALEARAQATLEELNAARGSVRSYPGGLSEREVEVLRHMALGRSNREIADSLFITLNTVANHVKSILNKTGAANRTEAAAYAFHHKLVERPAESRPGEGR